MALEYSDRVQLSESEAAQALAFAVETARGAGEVILPYFRSSVEIQNKLADGGFDPVTAADKAAEVLIRERVAAAYPDHGLLGEEFGSQAGNGLTWVIDPIDGTKSFMSGMLHWGVLIGLFDGQEPILGVMHQPFTGEVWFGDGNSAWYERGGERAQIHARSGVLLEESVLATTSPKFFNERTELAAYQSLEQNVRLTRYGGDCYIYALLAMGWLDIATDSTLNPYDIQALIPIIRGAGGVVTCWDGSNPSMGGAVIAAGDAQLHAQALGVLNTK